MKVTEFDIQIPPKAVCDFLGTDMDCCVYTEVAEELEEMLPQAYEKIKPVSMLAFGDFGDCPQMAEYKDAEEALYVIHSIGREISEWATELFAQGDCLRGMLADAIANAYLFQMDEQVQDRIIAMCRAKGRGIAYRLEAPQDIPMSIQKKAFDVTDAGRQAGISIRDSYMFDPVKTVCQAYVLDDNTERYHVKHDCRRCANITCRTRRIYSEIRVKEGNKEIVIQGNCTKTLLESFRENGIYIAAVCAGRGTCGKCRIRVLEGELLPSETDTEFFSERELEEGWRLACTAYPGTDCTVLIENRENEEFFVTTGKKTAAEDWAEGGGKYGIAADIGTTTVAMQLVETGSGEIVDVFTAINPQRAYGADVVSRIEASNSGKREELQRLIRKALVEGIRYLTGRKRIRIENMVIAGNTTMIHLLMGYSCETLGVYPFTPINIDEIHTTYEALFGNSDYMFDITICPGIAAYIGGDITAGLYALEFYKRREVAVLVDLGTNGEMAIGNKDRILTASAAAGPAFEGGNIICGTGSIPGAICKVEVDGEKISIETIGGKAPRGICGTGVIETVYELMKEEIVDKTGLMERPYFETGVALSEDAGIYFWQKDVREVQLAKSAVRAGLETLIARYGTDYGEIDAIYVAGGFGHKLDIHKAVRIGLFPAECEGKIRAVGNSCLRGAVKYLTEPEAQKDMKKLAERSKEHILSNDKMFHELYMEHMYLE